MNKQFIESYYLSDLSTCDNLISLFENSKNKTAGEISGGVNKTVKDSTDLHLYINDIVNSEVLTNYFKQLSDCLILYKQKYKFCDKGKKVWGLQNDFNIQKYKPSQAYHNWHTERGGKKTSNRHLVFMTYLNDVKKGGETEWYYQNLKIKPEKGLTVIWSADWTFTHKGHSTIDEDKYIITGWYEFKE